MSLKAIGILSPGDMGHAVGCVLVDNGMKVIACLEGRSKRTCELSKQAGIKEIPIYKQLVCDSDMILSILVPDKAKDVAKLVTQALEETGKQLVYVDCNAIAPSTAKITIFLKYKVLISIMSQKL